MNKVEIEIADWECTLLKKIHDDDLVNQYYREGFESDEEKNPHEFPEALADARLVILCKNGSLSDDERSELKRLGDEFETTKWSMWSKGYFRRNLFKEGKAV